MAVTWQLWQFARDPGAVSWTPIIVGTAVACVTSFFTLAAFLRLINRIGMTAFAAYRLVLAAIIVYVLI
jgi:undecaprenyl pyrophosphate phosphatase UppP